MTFVVASDVAFEQIVDAVEQDVGAVEHIEVVVQCEVIFVQPEKKRLYFNQKPVEEFSASYFGYISLKSKT